MPKQGSKEQAPTAGLAFWQYHLQIGDREVLNRLTPNSFTKDFVAFVMAESHGKIKLGMNRAEMILR